MPIYYQKIPQNEENESMSINGGHLPKTNFLRSSRANSYYELSEFDTGSSILSLDQICLEENVQLERIETRYGSVVVGKQVYSNGRPLANGEQNTLGNTASNTTSNGNTNIAGYANGNTNGNPATNGIGLAAVRINSPPGGQNNLKSSLKSNLKSSLEPLPEGGQKSNETKSGESNEAANKRREARRAKLNSIILTVHDIGLNHESNFLPFFNNLNVKMLLKNFTVYHLNLPGQHTSSEQISPIYAYPTMDQMSEIIDFVVGYYEIGKCAFQNF